MVLSTFLSAVANILHMVITAYIWVLIAAALISWIQPNPFNPIVQLLYKLTAPAYALVCKTRIPTVFGGIDLAPLLLIFALEFIDMFFIGLLHEIARSL
ncbi:YggT family protein [Campylobacter magnus]|uniref:YggT family protein n=1 Tax=Campylobacter magnus TaxID=3026462 RepID=A0ABT8T856_9BACT|nr:YggT family protein [Campylobacter magnus]MDO2409450.1 YggT family protein [Campylobacter magnus]